MAALRVRLFVCGNTNAAHRPRAPVPTPTPLRVKIPRARPRASCYPTATDRLVPPQPQARSRAAKSWPPPVPRGYRKSRTKARVHAYAHRGLARSLYDVDALHAPENEDASEQKNHFTPNTNNAQRAKKPEQHYPAPRRRLPYPPNRPRRGRPCACPRAPTSAKLHNHHPRPTLPPSSTPGRARPRI